MRNILVHYVALAAVGAAGCGDSAGEDAVAVLPRIVPWQVGAAGTAPLVIGMYDNQEKVPCRFLPDEIGQMRCLPWTVPGIEATGWYADDQCQKPIYSVDSRRFAPAVGQLQAVLRQQTGYKPDRYDVGRLAAMPVTALHYAGSPCVSGQFNVYDLQGKAELSVEFLSPPDQWASATEVDGPLLAGRLRLRQLETADGARFDSHFFDGKWNRRCTLENDGAAFLTCWPPTVLEDTTYTADAKCKGAPLWGGTRAGEPPVFIGRNARPYHAFGILWTGPVSRAGKLCQQVRGPLVGRWTTDDYHFYEMGAPLGDDAVAFVHWQTVGKGRIQLRGLRGDTGTVVPVSAATTLYGNTPRFRDTAANVDCDPVWAPGGAVYCVAAEVKRNPGTLDFFADAACTKPAYLCNDRPCVTPIIHGVWGANGELHADALEAGLPVAKVFTNSPRSEGCHASTLDLAPTLFVMAGDALPWDRYPLLDEINGHH